MYKAEKITNTNNSDSVYQKLFFCFCTNIKKF